MERFYVVSVLPYAVQPVSKVLAREPKTYRAQSEYKTVKILPVRCRERTEIVSRTERIRSQGSAERPGGEVARIRYFGRNHDSA